MMCGVIGISNAEKVSYLLYEGLLALQHRGQEGAGMAVSDLYNIERFRRLGLVENVFYNEGDDHEILESLTGPIGIGHVRYSTFGSKKTRRNVQPFLERGVATVHNGNLINIEDVAKNNGLITEEGMTDTEIALKIVANSTQQNLEEKVYDAVVQFEGAYCFLFMSKKKIVAVRDPLGYRPLVLGKKDGIYIVASETCALDHIGAEYIREVEPGEMVVLDNYGIRDKVKMLPAKKLSQCDFEIDYFARPDSLVFGQHVYTARINSGTQLAKQDMEKYGYCPGEIIIPIPDSGNYYAEGYSQESKVPLKQLVFRNKYMPRTFIMPQDKKTMIRAKLNLIKNEIKGKKVLFIDDSLVRGNTSKLFVEMLREAGAAEVHARFGTPPYTCPCYYGIDTPTHEELIASVLKGDIEKIRQYIGADTLEYLDMDRYKTIFKNSENHCSKCFGKSA